MREEQREKDLTFVTREGARDLYDRLCADYERKIGAHDSVSLHLIADIVMCEEIKLGLYEKRGMAMDAKSILTVRQQTEQQRKLLGELGMTPGGGKAVGNGRGDDFTAF